MKSTPDTIIMVSPLADINETTNQLPQPVIEEEEAMKTFGTDNNSSHDDNDDNNNVVVKTHSLIRKKNSMKMDRMIFAEDLITAAQESFSSLSLCVNDSANGTKTFNECYSKRGILGEGGFAIVYRCRHRGNKQYYAVKEILNEEYECNTSEDLKGEINALKVLRDGPKYVVRLLDIFQTPQRTHMIMEEMKGGDLLERITEKGNYKEREARKVSRTLFEAIAFCHKKGICHRDIKPENILLASEDDDTTIKLADFGCSGRITGPECLHTLCGTYRYAAPEVYYGEEQGYDERCDLWSAGVVVFALLGGYAPFDADNDDDLPEIVCAGQYEFDDPCWTKVSNAAKDLIKGLLQVNPNVRFSVNQALDSEWLRRRDRELMESRSNLSKSSLSASTGFNAKSNNSSFKSSQASFNAWLKCHKSDLTLNSIDLDASFSTNLDDSCASLSLDDL